jgi:hypothetical protein
MKIRQLIYCMFSVILAGLLLFLLMAFLQPKVAEAHTSQPIQSVGLTQNPGDPLKVAPDPPQANEPTELRVVLYNDGDLPVTLYAQFYWGIFGFGTQRTPIASRMSFFLPGHAEGSTAVVWVAPGQDAYCFYVDIFDAPEAQNPIASFRHNVIFRGYPNPDLPLYTESVAFLTRNPLPQQATVILSATVPISATHWDAQVYPREVLLQPFQTIAAQAVFTYTGGGGLPPGGTEAFLLSGTMNGEPLGEGQVIYGPPLRLHMRAEPPFAESEISVSPYPIPAGAPVEICAEVRNVTPQPREGFVTFRVAPLGIGLPYDPVAPPVHIFIPQLGIQRPCIQWVSPNGGQFAFDVQVEALGFPLLIESQRVLDVNEVLLPGTTSMLHFPVRNPFPQTVTIALALNPLQEGWGISIEPADLPNMQPFETRIVTLSVIVPPGSPMPPDGTPVADVEAYIGSEPIGGLRKIYRLPVPIHEPGNPIYAENEIIVRPYPPEDRQPTQICVEIRNPTDVEQTIVVDFNWAEFGIGLPWHRFHITDPIPMPPHSLETPCTMWVPPHGGRFGFEVGLQLAGHARVYSQRIIDVGEILLPNQPSPFGFAVSNPFTTPISVTMGVIRYLPQWEVVFNPPQFVLQAGATQPVEMVVNPVQYPGDPEPHEGEAVLDVEAYWQGNGENGLLGGFRKLFTPPIPIHPPQDPPYAESEISIIPYPPREREPTEISFEGRNPTPDPQQITITFQVSNFGIGLLFHDIARPISISVPPGSTQRVAVTWVPPFAGEFCVRVKAEAEFFGEPFYSARNLSIVRLPVPYGAPEVFTFAVGDNGNPTRPLTVTLGLKEYLPNWHVTLDPTVLVFEPGQSIITSQLTITPPADPAELPIDGGPIADVPAFVNGELIGGIRKIWRPPVPLGDPQEPSYAESEIAINPDPPLVGQPATFGAQLRNNSDYSQTITTQFGWADFGIGVPFTNTNVTPTITTLTLGPHMTTTISADWMPIISGNICVQILLTNEETGEEQHSQRNVNVIEVPETLCEPIIKEFWLQNPTAETVTVTIGANAINLPPGWTYTVDPAEATLAPYEGITVTVTITPLCELSTFWGISGLIEAGNLSHPEVQVEGYDQGGELIGGVEIQLISAVRQPFYLPLVLHNSSQQADGNSPPEASSPAAEPSQKISTKQLLGATLLLIGGAGIYLRRVNNR